MPRKRIGVALWEHYDAEGLRHIVYFGDEVDVTDEELVRGERAGVFAPDEPEPVDDELVDDDTTPDQVDVVGLTKVDPSAPFVPFVDGQAETVATDDKGQADQPEPVDEGQADAAAPTPVAPEDDGQADAPEMPKQSGTKEAWVRYAVAKGMPKAEATALTRDELKVRFLGASS